MNPNNLNEHEPGFLESLAGAAIIIAVEIVFAFLVWVALKAVMP